MPPSTRSFFCPPPLQHLVHNRKTEGKDIFSGVRVLEVIDATTQVVAQTWNASGIASRSARAFFGKGELAVGRLAAIHDAVFRNQMFPCTIKSGRSVECGARVALETRSVLLGPVARRSWFVRRFPPP